MTKKLQKAARRPHPSPHGSSKFRNDPKSRIHGGWKIHLSIGPDRYEERLASIKSWLEQQYKGEWKCVDSGDGGEPHEKDFTIYLGSFVTMTAFVEFFQSSSIADQVDFCNAGSGDRVVGSSSKCGARFDPRRPGSGDDWQVGYRGIPFTLADATEVLSRRSSSAQVADRNEQLLRLRFGDYFLPNNID